MRFVSTRGEAPPASFEEAVQRGIAPDGGLYVPDAFPRFEPDAFTEPFGLAEVAGTLLRPFVADGALASALAGICTEAFNFPIPTRPLETGTRRLSMLEVFHGPTAAFKDVGARFLAGCLERLNRAAAMPLTILVATSGDTGGAVAAAFHGRPNTRVVVLFPEGLVSPRQEKQLTCWGENVLSLAVRGTFDDCQRLVKAAFRDPGLAQRHRLTSANSINLGRLLPQTVYYARTALEQHARDGHAPSFIVPTGNLGNAQACIWARAMGLPIGRVVLATNANRPIPDYLEEGRWRPRPSVATLASAMDVGDPSNMERLLWQYRHDVDAIREAVTAVAVDDALIRAEIARAYRRYGVAFCPHTATALYAYGQLPQALREAHHWVVVGTAHPAKFETVVEPLIDASIPVPPALAALLELPSQGRTISPDLAALAKSIDEYY